MSTPSPLSLHLRIARAKLMAGKLEAKAKANPERAAELNRLARNLRTGAAAMEARGALTQGQAAGERPRLLLVDTSDERVAPAGAEEQATREGEDAAMPVGSSGSVAERPEGFVYLLHSIAMPGLYKVGRTNRNPYERAAELSNTSGIPIAFGIVSAAFVKDCAAVERRLHQAFEEVRVNTSREFFAFPDDDFARKRFRDEILALADQLEDFGIGNAAHDLRATGAAIRDGEEAQRLACRQAAKIADLEAKVRTLEDTLAKERAEEQVRVFRSIQAYKKNSDDLAERISQIRAYCVANAAKPAGTVVAFIDDPATRQ